MQCDTAPSPEPACVHFASHGGGTGASGGGTNPPTGAAGGGAGKAKGSSRAQRARVAVAGGSDFAAKGRAVASLAVLPAATVKSTSIASPVGMVRLDRVFECRCMLLATRNAYARVLLLTCMTTRACFAVSNSAPTQAALSHPTLADGLPMPVIGACVAALLGVVAFIHPYTYR